MGIIRTALRIGKQRYGEKPQSLHDRLKSKKQDIKERELTRPYSPPNRGRRVDNKRREAIASPSFVISP